MADQSTPYRPVTVCLHAHSVVTCSATQTQHGHIISIYKKQKCYVGRINAHKQVLGWLNILQNQSDQDCSAHIITLIYHAHITNLSLS